MLSLWSVEDEATSLLMRRFYQNLLGRRDGLKGPMPKAEALDEAKRWLRNLSADEADAQAAGLPRGPVVEIAKKPVAKVRRRYEHP